MVTNWQPDALDPAQPLYRAITDRLAADIEDGVLATGTQLPTVRALAESLGVTMGTVYRAYGLAERRGLINKEVGRGTFVRERVPRQARAARAAEAGLVDLSRNEPPYIDLEDMLRRSLQEISRNSSLDGMLEYGDSQGFGRHREALASWLATRGFKARAEHLIISGGAQQALTIALGAVTRPGDVLLVEAYSYPGIRNLARFFGLTLIPVAMDADGLDPAALEQVCRAQQPRALYCMPHAQNPTTATLPEDRRRRIGALAAEHGVTIIEDDVNPRGTAAAYTPIAALFPQQSVYISSLSKSIAPGLRIGALAAPDRLFDRILAASQTTSWMAPPLMAELASIWIQDGTAAQLAAQRIAITHHLLAIARECLADLPYHADADNSHLWLPLPGSWSAAEFAARCAEAGVRVSPSNHFAIDTTDSLAAVRICLTNIDDARLRQALSAVAGLVTDSPMPTAFQM